MRVYSFNATLSTISFYILLAVADRPHRAYGIRSQIIADSEGELIPPTGSVYPAIKRLTKTGLLEKFEVTDLEGQIIQSYRITPQGRTRLEQEAQRLNHVSYHARLKLGLKIFERTSRTNA